MDAVTNFDDPKVIAEVSKVWAIAMKGIEISTIKPEERMQERGW